MDKSKSLVKVNPEQVAQKIIGALAGGLQAAADIYRQFVADGGDPMELRRHVPVSAEVWRTLDDVASGRIDTRTFCLPGRTAAALRALPKTTQTDILDDGIEVLATDGSGIRVPIAELSAAQVCQVFGPAGVRSLSEQAAWAKSRVDTIPAPRPHAQFEIRKNRLVVFEPVELSMADLHRILAQMG